MGAVSSCCSLVPMRSSSVCFLFPCCFSFICSFPWRLGLSSRPIRLVVRLVSCVSSRAFRPSCRASCRLSCRLAVSSRRLVSVCRLVWAPFRSAVRLFSSRSPWRDCPFVVVPPCWSRRSPICSSSRPCVGVGAGSSRSSRLVSVVSFSSVISFCLIRGRLGFVFMPVPVFAPFRPARRSFLPHSIRSRSSVPVSVSVVGRGCVSRAWGGGACSCRFIRSMLLSAHPLPAHVPSFLPSHRLIAPIAFSYHHPKQENERGRRRRAIERETRKQRGGYNKTP